MAGHSRTQLDACQVGQDFYGTTLVLGSHVGNLADMRCSPDTCQYPLMDHPVKLRERRPKWKMMKNLEIPPWLVGCLLGEISPEEKTQVGEAKEKEFQPTNPGEKEGMPLQETGDAVRTKAPEDAGQVKLDQTKSEKGCGRR